jgi:acetyltransferase-like isoleucine patch superfamily enzyme
MIKLLAWLQRIPDLLGDVWLCAIQNLPGPLGLRLRYGYWKKRLKHLGKNTRIEPAVYFQNPQFISIADNCLVDRGVIILAGIDNSNRKKTIIQSKDIALRGEVAVGRNVHIGPYSIVSGIDGGILIGDDCTFSSGVKVYAFSHHYRFDDDPENHLCSFGSMVDHSRQSIISGAIILEDNVGVALNTVILPGVLVGRNSFILANSFLYKQEFPENSLISGSPAKWRGRRFQAINEIDGI